MSFLNPAALAGIRALGEQFMATDVVITRRSAYTADDTNAFGDDTIEFSTSSVTVKGWVVAHPTTSFGTEQEQIVQSGLTLVRVPSGTVVEPGDKVVMNDIEYRVVDSTAESDLATWVVVYLKRLQ